MIRFIGNWIFILVLLLSLVSIGMVPASLHPLRMLGSTIAALICAESISWTIGMLFFRERPFVHLHFRPLIAMSPRWKSFPSDHTTIGFTIAFMSVFLGSPFGLLFCILMVGVGIARIAAGVHYPSDVLAGLLLALFSSAVVALSSLILFS